MKVDSAKIFIKICSLDDSELVPTIYDAILKAEDPSSLNFGIYLQYRDTLYLKELEHNLPKFKQHGSNFKVISEPLKKSMLGVGKARHKVDSMYDNEEYVLQIDAHSWFPLGWDNRLKELLGFHSAKTILTGYAAPYIYEDNIRVPVDLGKLLYKQYTTEKVINNWLYPQWITCYPKSNEYFMDVDFCANFAFGTYEWGKYSGINKESIFFSEEPIQTMNLKRKGFTLLYPNIDEPLICHLYANDITTKGERRSIYSYLSKLDAEHLFDVVDRNIYENYLNKQK